MSSHARARQTAEHSGLPLASCVIFLTDRHVFRVKSGEGRKGPCRVTLCCKPLPGSVTLVLSPSPYTGPAFLSVGSTGSNNRTMAPY